MGEKEYEYFFDPDDMKYYLKADHSDEGTAITIENGVITEQTKDHLMVYELTDGREDNPAPLSSYEAAETLRLLFEKRRYDKQGHRFITYENEDYPF